MTSQHKIIQIMPADSKWEAVYIHSKDSDQRFNSKAWHTYPLECWALVEIERERITETLVMGMVIRDQSLGFLQLIDLDDEEFLAYTRVDEGYDWQEEALEQRKHKPGRDS